MNSIDIYTDRPIYRPVLTAYMYTLIPFCIRRSDGGVCGGGGEWGGAWDILQYNGKFYRMRCGKQ